MEFYRRRVSPPQPTLDEILTYDKSPPPMGVYNTIAFSMMKGRPYDGAWDFVFNTMDVRAQFAVAMQSPQMCRLVMSYIRRHAPDSCHIDELRRGGAGDHLSKLPVDVFSTVFRRTGMAASLNLSRSSRKFRALYARYIQSEVTRLLRRFNMSHAEFRFMQTATLAVISGPTLARFFLSESDCDTDKLEIYAPNNSYSAVIRFFSVATDYYGKGLDHGFTKTGVNHFTDLFHRTHDSAVRVHRSATDSALDPIPYFPFTHLFFAVTHYGAWIAYPWTSSRAVTFPSREGTTLLSVDSSRQIILALEDYITQFLVCFHLNRPHVCGISFECPATLRDTSDGGCLNLFFPSPPLGAPSQSHSVYPVPNAMSWSLSASCCPSHRSSNGSLVRCRADGYTDWKSCMQEHIFRKARDVVLSQLSRGEH
ncbi:hypothetical protein C8R47DRAFT_1228457 [Mycena vitilis]|nr:hypothetical protein C8R47DRAFT_1228457 [Mycena vitilis]